MFNDDEVLSALTKMYESSPVDGFIEISEGLGEMIKSLANEPSMGLFYVQQHTHTAIPNLVNFRNNMLNKSREISLHTEDSEDSITMVRSMKECGFPIVDDMVKDITKSLAIMSSKQPKKGLISSKPVLGFPTGRTSSWVRSINNGEKSSNYLSSVFKSARQKTTNLKWAQLDTPESMEEATTLPQDSGANGSANSMQRIEEDLPVSSNIAIGIQEKDALDDEFLLNLPPSEDFDEFKTNKEAQMEEWLGDIDTQGDQHRGRN